MADTEHFTVTPSALKDGLRAVLRRNPELSQAEIARWAGVVLRTFYDYAQGRGPDLTAYSRVLDLIFGRVLPRQLEDGSWVFERIEADTARAAYVRFLDRTLDAAHAFKEAVSSAAADVRPEMQLPHVVNSGLTARDVAPSLVETTREVPMSAAVQDYDDRYANDDKIQFNAVIFRSQRERVKVLAARRGVDQSKITRAAIERYLEAEEED